MRIEQAMATPKAKGPQALETLDAFVRSLKDSGFLQAALQRHQVKGASLTP
jgi:polar amino acid transport system substrate-binding protein